jgi:hypothetical protein
MAGPVRKLIICLVALLLLGGCAHNVRIRVLDAQTARPLESVHVYMQEDRHQILEPVKSFGRTNLPPTGPDGVFVIKRTHTWSLIYMTLSRTNYVTCYGNTVTAGPICYSELRMLYESGLPEGEFRLVGTVSVAQKSNGFQTILMRPN